MKSYSILLLRGINVGGKCLLPMTGLRAILEGLGLEDVRTYIQSGNAVFRSVKPVGAALVTKVRERIGKAYGFEPELVLLGSAEWAKVMRGNPFQEAEPGTLHLFFLIKPAKSPDLDGLEGLRSGREAFRFTDRVMFLHLPEGVGKSKLATGLEKKLGVPVTGRNWRTVCKLAEMVGG